MPTTIRTVAVERMTRLQRYCPPTMTIHSIPAGRSSSSSSSRMKDGAKNQCPAIRAACGDRIDPALGGAFEAHGHQFNGSLVILHFSERSHGVVERNGKVLRCGEGTELGRSYCNVGLIRIGDFLNLCLKTFFIFKHFQASHINCFVYSLYIPIRIVEQRGKSPRRRTRSVVLMLPLECS